MKRMSMILRNVAASAAVFGVTFASGLGMSEAMLSKTGGSSRLGAYILRTNASSSAQASSRSSFRRRVRRVNRSTIVRPRTRTGTGSSSYSRIASSQGAIKAGCGDELIIRDLGETCDDGNAVAGDGCSDKCVIETGFTCAGLPSVCRARCGDGIKTAVEKCDDGDLDGGDGCSALCKIEFGYVCNSASPNFCEPIPYCGDGVKASTEQCDDGNTAPNDGCYNCLTE